MKKRLLPLFFVAGIMLVLTACNFPGDNGQPTISPYMIYTAAAQTLIAQQTQSAEGTPIVLPSPTTGNVVPTSTSPVVILPTNTSLPPTNTLIPTNTAVPTNTPVPPTPTAIPIPCDRGQFVSDQSIPDNTPITAGATFQKTWRLKNNGSCTWTSSYAVVFYNGDAMSGPSSAPITNGTVPPGSTVDVTVTLIAPTTPGTYKGNWRLRNGGGAVFGIGTDADQSFWVQIKSVVPTPTPPPTPAYTLSFDFIGRGPDAEWRNATKKLAWGDPPEDSAGVAVNVANVKMEDGKTYASLLATYPQHIENGVILGKYPSYTIQNNDHLRTQIGFRYNCETSNAKFQIRYIEGASEVTVGEWLEKCDGTLTTLDVNLAALVGHTVQFELVVIASGSPDTYSTLWVSPRIER
ncbi:MAG TPA: NBR1-Ig-like domain-containing protein [Anaerolineales bacterium]